MANLITAHNAKVLSHYTLLQEERKEPVLAVYRDTYLIITSYTVEGAIEFLINKIKKIGYDLLSLVGILQINPERIQQLRAAVSQYHFSYVKRQMEAHITPLENRAKATQRMLDQLALKKQALLAENVAVEADKNAHQEQLKKLQTELHEAQELISQKEYMEKQLQDLKNNIDHLESIRESIPNYKKEQEQLLATIEKYTSILQELKADCSQADYKTQVTTLQIAIQQLQQQLACAQNQSWQSDARFYSEIHQRAVMMHFSPLERLEYSVRQPILGGIHG